VFNEEMFRNQVRKMGLEKDLRKALAHQEFLVVYQPKWDSLNNRMIGIEALLRWNHPEFGIISPGEFIPIAEANGTILPIGRWTIVEACRQIRAWQDEGITPPVVGVNISAAQLKLSPDFDALVARSLAEYDVAASQLELELTESVLMETTRRNKELFERIERIGVRLAIDDFGTGYSSLDYLATFHVSRLKIDRRFISGVATNPRDDTIVRATISLAHELGLEVVAEGLENAKQKAFLMSVGCNVAQGNYLAVPMPAARVSALLRR
ncbi:MAG: EAL domain-containing protein, partial [Bauldia sp.]